MWRDVIVTQDNNKHHVRVEGDMDTREISDIVAKRLAYEYVFGHPANDVVVERYVEIAPLPDAIIGLDAKAKWERPVYSQMRVIEGLVKESPVNLERQFHEQLIANADKIKLEVIFDPDNPAKPDGDFYYDERLGADVFRNPGVVPDPTKPW